MVGSIERLRRQIQVRNVAPMMLLVIGVSGTPDPIAKRIGGTAGVIAMPATTGTPSSSAHGDFLPNDPRRDSRADRVRILYPPGRAPRDTTTAAARPIRKQACVEPQAVRGRGRTSAPTS
ncbi:MAG TPA: hypothetical protein VGM82_09940 [Gemmatimonadaceae bacterium]|jgi:hypothetical protein